MYLHIERRGKILIIQLKCFWRRQRAVLFPPGGFGFGLFSDRLELIARRICFFRSLDRSTMKGTGRGGGGREELSGKWTVRHFAPREKARNRMAI